MNTQQVTIDGEEYDLDDWRKRGFEDAAAERGALFRVRRGRVHAAGEPPEHWSADAEHAIGLAYLEGYNA